MSHHEIDAYLTKVGEPHRSTLQALRQTIHEIVPQAEEVISYGMPGFRLKGKMICGIAAFKDHVAYLPHSGSVFSEMPAELKAYKWTPGSLHLPIDKPPPKSLVKKLIALRRKQAGV
jgi:uncharacterized protein YdhG (YjbR/CyaY superfamily)